MAVQVMQPLSIEEFYAQNREQLTIKTSYPVFRIFIRQCTIYTNYELLKGTPVWRVGHDSKLPDMVNVRAPNGRIYLVSSGVLARYPNQLVAQRFFHDNVSRPEAVAHMEEGTFFGVTSSLYIPHTFFFKTGDVVLSDMDSPTVGDEWPIITNTGHKLRIPSRFLESALDISAASAQFFGRKAKDIILHGIREALVVV